MSNSPPIDSLLRNTLRDKLSRGEVVSSMTVRLVRTAEIARIARSAGFDSIYVDLEHCSFSLDDTSRICMACLDAGVTPLVAGGALLAVALVRRRV